MLRNQSDSGGNFLAWPRRLSRSHGPCSFCFDHLTFLCSSPLASELVPAERGIEKLMEIGLELDFIMSGGWARMGERILSHFKY